MIEGQAQEIRADDAKTLVRDRIDAGSFPFQLLHELAVIPHKQWLIKGVFAAGETSAWIGPPGSLKSALLAQAAWCVATGDEWHGRKNKGQAGVLYFALERADLVKRRLSAERERAGLMAHDRLPIAVAPIMVDLMDPATVTKVVATIKRASEEFQIPVGLVIFDTFAKLIAAGGGDENLARDQGRVFANIQRVKQATGVHVALVGHTGKDQTRGARGSNAILGDVDLLVMITGEGIKTAEVTKGNDMPEGPLFSFESEMHVFGTDEDGDTIDVNIISAREIEAKTNGKAEKPLTGNAKSMFMLLSDAGPEGLTTEEWNLRAREQGIGVKRRVTLYETRSKLKSTGHIRCYNDRWTVNHTG